MTKGVIVLILGFCLLIISGALLYINLNTHLLTDKTYYRIGTIEDYKGKVTKFTQDVKTDKIGFGDPIFSNQAFTLENESYLEVQINSETVNILGPAKFSFNVVNPNTKKVFINFNQFTEVLPKKFESDSIILTYKGWTVEPFFNPKTDLEKSEKTLLDKSPNAFDEDTAFEETEPKPIPEEEKPSYLEEIISIKRPLLKKCYENYLKENPLATGELTVEFTLQNNGRVSSARVKDSSFFRSELFKTCIVNVFKQIRSRPFAGDTLQVTYPIEFY